MAKRSARELTFKRYPKPRKGGRWCKKICHKTYYFGTGGSRSDRESYQAAVQEYRAFRDGQLQDELRDEQLQDAARAYSRGERDTFMGVPVDEYFRRACAEAASGGRDTPAVLQASPNLRRPDAVRSGDGPWHYHDVLDPDALDEESRALGDLLHRQWLRRVQEVAHKREPVVSKTSATQTDHPIAQHIDVWIEYERQRHEHGEITQEGYTAKRHGIKPFRDRVGTQCFGSPAEVEDTLQRYRVFLLGKHQTGAWAATTVNDRLKFLGQFISFCYRRRLLAEQPRTLPEVCRRLPTQPGGQPILLDDLGQLWRGADTNMRCWMALALNCGLKNRDIGELRPEHFVEGRLVMRRHKTGVPMNVKLWPETLALLGPHIANAKPNEVIFHNKAGGPLVRTGSNGLCRYFKTLRRRTGVAATFEQLRDTGAQHLRQWARAQSVDAQAVVQLYLAHKDKSTARFYVSQDPADAQAKILDDAVDALREAFGVLWG